MNITGVKIRAIRDDTRPLKAVVSVTIDDELVLHDMKIIEEYGKRFLSMPRKTDPLGKYRNLYHPITREGRRQLEQAVFEAYEKQLNDMGDYDNGSEN